MDPRRHLQTALVARYRVERLIGVGGMATVYLARHLRHDRNVALKLLKPELGAVLGVERFLSEIRVTAHGDQPLWSRDGRDLFFRDGTSLIAATMNNGIVQSRTALFADTYQPSNATNYDVLPDGRFIMLKGSGDVRVLTVMMNWATELNQRLKATPR